MFRVTAGMGWLDSLPWSDSDGNVIYPNVVFLSSYVIIANWTLLQVCVRVRAFVRIYVRRVLVWVCLPVHAFVCV